MVDVFSLTALAQIVLIDLSLAGDNALVVGMAAAGLPMAQRHRAIFLGIVAAALLRIVFAVFTTQLMHVFGLTLAGGLLLLWVCWKMFQELRRHNHPASADQDGPPAAHKTLRQAVTQIVVADVSMSLDNVLAVAGAARDHWLVLVAGLALSVVLMGVAATAVVKLLHRFRWIGYAGLAVVLYVAVRMIWDGGFQVAHGLTAS